MEIFKIMIISLVSTIILELLGAYILKVRDKYDLLNIILVNLLTNPLVVSISFFINIRYGLWVKKIVVIFLELFAFITEGAIYNRVLEYKKFNGYLLSFLLNFISYFCGILINNVIW